MIFNFDPDRVSCCAERTNGRTDGRTEGGGDGEGITYWAEKAKKRMTALSVVRSNAEKDGRGAAAAVAYQLARCARIPAVKLMMLSKPRHFSIDGKKGRVARPGQSRSISTALGSLPYCY